VEAKKRKIVLHVYAKDSLYGVKLSHPKIIFFVFGGD
jgi:hypothetical protein